MAKKSAGTKKNRVEILDDNGTLIATCADAPGAAPGGADHGEASDKRDIPEPS